MSNTMNKRMAVAEGSQITLHFAIMLHDGEEIDRTPEDKPATFVIGDGSMLPGFEKILIGLKAGDKRSAVIESQQAFGAVNDANIQMLPRNQFDDSLNIEPGLVIAFADAAKAEVPGMVTEFDDQFVTIDFNHPLAGKDLLFEVEIITIHGEDGQQTVSLK